MCARVAALFANGLFAVYDLLELSGELRATHLSGAAATGRVGRVADIGWLPLPSPIGERAGRCARE